MKEFIELRRLISIVLRRWYLPVGLMLIGGILAYTISQRQTKVYESTTTLLVGQTIFETELDRQDILANELAAQSYREMVSRQPVLQAVVESLNLDQSWQQLRRQVRVELVEGTQFIQITVEASDPETAQIIADEVARQTILFSPVEVSSAGSEETRRFVQDQLESLQARIENGQNRLELLQIELVTTDSTERLSELQVEVTTLEDLITSWETNYTQLLTFLESGNPPNKLTVIEPAQVKRTPVRPQDELYILVGSGVGFFLGIGLIFLIDFLDDTLKPFDDVTEEFGLPVLGTISKVRGSERNSVGVYVSKHPRSPTAEAYRLLRANLDLISAEQRLKTIMITSSDTEVGKSSVSSNLAIIMAQNDRKIILLDADLRKSNIHKLMSLDQNPGLSDVILQKKEISDVLQTYQVVEDSKIKANVITSGASPPNPSELLGSTQMDQVLARLEEMSEVVIIDAPPLIVSESVTLSPMVDGVLLVVRPGYTRKRLVNTTMERLKRAKANVIGVILNGVAEREAKYYGAYVYSPDSKEEWQEAEGWMPAVKRRFSGVSSKLDPVTSVLSKGRERISTFIELTGGEAENRPSDEDQPSQASIIQNGKGPEKIAISSKSCHNEDCPDYGIPQSEAQNNIIKSGTSDKGVQRYLCKTCEKTYLETAGTIFHGKHASEDEILESLAFIAQGGEVSDLAIEKGVREETIVNWLQEAAQHPEQVNKVLIDDFKVEPDQLEALWKNKDGRGGNSEPKQSDKST